jgi:hypothetical protein
MSPQTLNLIKSQPGTHIDSISPLLLDPIFDKELLFPDLEEQPALNHQSMLDLKMDLSANITSIESKPDLLTNQVSSSTI